MTLRLHKALVYNPKTGESAGTVQHEGKTLRFAKPTFGNKVRALLAGEEFMANRPAPSAHLTPHALSGALSPVHTTLRGMGLHFRSTINPVKGLHEFSHVVSSPHNSADATIGALHARLKQTHKVTKPVWTGKSWGFTATAKDGQRHHFVGAENSHVQAVHNAFATFGNVRAKTSQAQPGSGHHYTHDVQTAHPGAARDIFAQHFAGQGFKVRKVASGLHLTHGMTGVRHKIAFKQAPMLGPKGAVPPSPTPATSAQKRSAQKPVVVTKQSVGRGNSRRAPSAVPA